MPPAELFPFLLPLCLVAAGGLACLGLEAFLPRESKHRILPWIGAAFLIAAGIAQASDTAAGHVFGLLALDGARAWLVLAIVAASALALGGLQQSLTRDDYPGGEPYALTLFAACGAILMTMAVDSIALFMGLELASLSVYALVGLRRHRLESNEALFKYFAMGAVFSAIFLYGAALTYGATGSTAFGHAPVDAARHTLLVLGQSLMVIGLLFKVGAVPFHFWSPDAYTGAPVAVTGFMGAVIKVGGFAALGALWLNFVSITGGAEIRGPIALDAMIAVPDAALADQHLRRFHLVFLVAAVLSLLLGNFSALKQSSARRMIAFSSVAHSGYMLLAFALPSGGDGTATFELASLWYYLVAYAIATAGALTAIAALSGRDDVADDLAGLAGRGRAKPLHGAVLTVFMASFAGVPPTAGFLAKYLVLADLVAKDQIALAIIAMVMAVVGAAYYLRLVITVWSAPSGEPAEAEGEAGPALAAWGLALAALVTIALIVKPAIVAPVRPAAPPPATASIAR